MVLVSSTLLSACSVEPLEKDQPSVNGLMKLGPTELHSTRPYHALYNSQYFTQSLKYTIVVDYLGDTLSIYENNLGGMNIVNMSQQRLVNNELKNDKW